MAARIKTAREEGDLKENAEYHIAKEDQAHLETKIKRLRERLRTAVVVEVDASADTFAFGRTAEVLDEAKGEVNAWTLVGSTEANLGRGPPIGRVPDRPSPAQRKGRQADRDRDPPRQPNLRGPEASRLTQGRLAKQIKDAVSVTCSARERARTPICAGQPTLGAISTGSPPGEPVGLR